MFLESGMSLSPKHIYWGLWIPSQRPLPSNDVRRALLTNHLKLWKQTVIKRERERERRVVEGILKQILKKVERERRKERKARGQLFGTGRTDRRANGWSPNHLPTRVHTCSGQLRYNRMLSVGAVDYISSWCHYVTLKRSWIYFTHNTVIRAWNT